MVQQDLLQPQNSDLLIREGDSGVFVAGVHEVEVGSMEDCLRLLQIGERNRLEPQLQLLWQHCLTAVALPLLDGAHCGHASPEVADLCVVEHAHRVWVYTVPVSALVILQRVRRPFT